MTDRLCVRQVCADITTSSGLRVCRGCRAEVATELARLPGLYDDCQQTPAYSSRPVAGRTRRRRGVRPGIPLDEAAADARSNIIGVLAAWSALVADERGVIKPTRREAADLARFLIVHMDWLLSHPAAAEFAAEVTTAARAASRAAEVVPERRTRLGGCPEPGCGASVVARAGEVSCEAGHSWLPHQWLILSRQLSSREDGAA